MKEKNNEQGTRNDEGRSYWELGIWNWEKRDRNDEGRSGGNVQGLILKDQCLMEEEKNLFCRGWFCIFKLFALSWLSGDCITIFLDTIYGAFSRLEGHTGEPERQVKGFSWAVGTVLVRGGRGVAVRWRRNNQQETVRSGVLKEA